MYIVGIDLSGPTNTKNTTLVSFASKADQLTVQEIVIGASDEAILKQISDLSEHGQVVVGLDAPLSYQPGGGDRPSDHKLRSQVLEIGLPAGSVMPPTQTRMAYLTLRGITVARFLKTIEKQPPAIVEVHPGASMALRGAPLRHVINLKKSTISRQELLKWLEQKGLLGIAKDEPDDHYIAACSCALAAWKWYQEDSVWLEPAQPPWHPFDYAC
jgi:predicted nuclease with RNAse H fold